MGVTTQKNRTGQNGIRLTRRGRIVVIAGMAMLTLAVLWLGARHGAGAADDSGVRATHRALPTVGGRAAQTRCGRSPCAPGPASTRGSPCSA